MKITISFKDPDFCDGLVNAGMTRKAAKSIERKAEFGEYFRLELTLDAETGKIEKARFVK